MTFFYFHVAVNLTGSAIADILALFVSSFLLLLEECLLEGYIRHVFVKLPFSLEPWFFNTFHAFVHSTHHW